MRKRMLSLALAFMLTHLAGAIPVYAVTKEEDQARSVAEVKERVRRFSSGERVKVKLKNKTKLKGYIREAGEDSFVVVDQNSGAVTTVPYSQVSQVKKSSDLSEGVKLAIGLGALTALVLILASQTK